MKRVKGDLVESGKHLVMTGKTYRLAFNQRVVGSSPTRLIQNINEITIKRHPVGWRFLFVPQNVPHALGEFVF
jgi:hypothetical protein